MLFIHPAGVDLCIARALHPVKPPSLVATKSGVPLVSETLLFNFQLIFDIT